MKLESYNCPYCGSIDSVIPNEYDECFCVKCGEGPIGKHNRFNKKYNKPKRIINRDQLEDNFGNR